MADMLEIIQSLHVSNSCDLSSPHSESRSSSQTWVYAVDYLEIIGIICGQILVGFEGDWIGRRFGMVQDAVIMAIGTTMLIAAWGTSLNGWVICYAWSLWVYGVGVGVRSFPSSFLSFPHAYGVP